MDRTSQSVDTLNRLAKCEECDERIQDNPSSCPVCGSENIDYNWNSLQNAYSLHDIGEAFVRTHVEHLDLEVEAWGIDMREDDESLIFDDKMDLKIVDPNEGGTLRSITEVKTKRTGNWFGKINRRHFRHYLQHAHGFDVSTFVYMSLVDEADEDDEEDRIVRDTFIEIEPWDEFAEVLAGEHPSYDPEGAEQFLLDHVDRHPLVDYTFRAPDGNLVVELDTEVGIDWPQFSARITDV